MMMLRPNGKRVDYAARLRMLANTGSTVEMRWLPGQEDAVKVRAVLKRLLVQWLATVQRLALGEAAFLAYDFADQYTGLLRCQREKEMMSVCTGWSVWRDWLFSPSSLPVGLAVVPEFTPPTSALGR